MPKKQTTDWTVFLAKFHVENKGKGMSAPDVMAKAAEAWRKMTADQKKLAGKASRTDWTHFLAEYRMKNKGKSTEGGAGAQLSNASHAWKKLSDAQKAAYGPKK